MVTPEGERVGEHQGLMYYTLGQRQGLGIGGRRDAPAQPWYVAAKDMSANKLIVVQGHDHPLLFGTTVEVGDASWIEGETPRAGEALAAKTRYRQADAPCRLEAQDRSRFRLRFQAPQWAMTPGQSAVVYRGEECLGGGVIL
jgi:tRNA-specific 2-thiouridylase